MIGRRVKDVIIEADNRDKGKKYRLTEMSASEGEWWGERTFLSLARAGVTIPDTIRGAGLAGLAMLGLKAFGGIAWEDAKILLEDMFKCVQFVSSANIVRPLIEDDIEEISTRLKLRQELFEIHLGFTFAELLLKLSLATKSAGSSDTPISLE